METIRNSTDEVGRTVPVVMLTADANEATIMTAARWRVNGYLLKPVSPKQVASLFGTIFDPPPLP